MAPVKTASKDKAPHPRSSLENEEQGRSYTFATEKRKHLHSHQQYIQQQLNNQLIKAVNNVDCDDTERQINSKTMLETELRM